MTNKINSVLIRLLKGIIAGAIASMGLVTLSQPAIWSDFNTMLSHLGLALVYGAVTGLLLALQKYVSWTDTEN